MENSQSPYQPSRSEICGVYPIHPDSEMRFAWLIFAAQCLVLTQTENELCSIHPIRSLKLNLHISGWFMT